MTHRPGDETWLRVGDVLQIDGGRHRVTHFDLVFPNGPDELGEWVAFLEVETYHGWTPVDFKVDAQHGEKYTKA